MTTETEDQVIARRGEVLSALYDAVTGLRREIERLTADADAGDLVDEPAARAALNKIRDLITQCTKAETLLDESRSKQNGIARGGYALDMDRARVEIGCKLDRLRRCRRPRAVPE